jgi:Na+-translocating ferredoxin:NAD+ oxidoreductase RnfG subunit
MPTKTQAIETNLEKSAETSTTEVLPEATPDNNTEETIWLVIKRFQGTTNILSAYKSDSGLFAAYPALADDSHTDADANGNGYQALKVVLRS